MCKCHPYQLFWKQRFPIAFIFDKHSEWMRYIYYALWQIHNMYEFLTLNFLCKTLPPSPWTASFIAAKASVGDIVIVVPLQLWQWKVILPSNTTHYNTLHITPHTVIAPLISPSWAPKIIETILHDIFVLIMKKKRVTMK